MNKKKPAKQENSGRDKKGRFLPGVSGNPKGKPVFSITTLIKQKLQECPEGMKKETYVSQLIKKILDKAIKDGDVQMQKTIWAYIDGMPKQSSDIADVLKDYLIQEQTDALLHRRPKKDNSSGKV